MPHKKHLNQLTLASLLVSASCISFASGLLEDNPFWNIPLSQLGQISLTTLASGSSTPLDKAAAVVTVLTQEDIASIGATDIDHILETVPGLHVNHSEQALFSKYVFRGVTSTFNQQALMMINGVPVTALVIGNRGNVWGGMPIKAISRIEVIRGSGSALYGAEAFSGIINIETKNHSDIVNQAGVRAGSFDAKGGWLEATTSDDGLHASVVFEYQQTDGWHETIEHDAQTNLDAVFGSHASFAPGEINAGNRQTDVRLELSTKDWTLRSGFQERSNLETGPGVAQAIDPQGEFASERFNVDFTYKLSDLGIEGFDVDLRSSYYRDNQSAESNVLLFPPGAFGGAFPEGFIGNPGYKEEQARLDIKSLYQGFTQHRLQSGVGMYWGDLYDVSESKNFNADFSPKPEGVVDVSDDSDEVWLREEERNNWYVFVQDEWQFSKRWALTSGARYDHYSDFGGTINPRLALVWATTDAITTKFLYGRAFRAPSLNDLYSENNPVVLGNDRLNPEVIDTFEWVFGHTFNSKFNYSLNVFHYQITDLISATPNPDLTETRELLDNVGERKGYGGEFEFTYRPTDQVRLLANYAYQKSVDRDTNSNVGEAPNHQVYGRIEWQFKPGWHFTTQTNWVGEQKRVHGDNRNPVDDYITLDMTIRALQLWSRVDFSFTVRNAFDATVKDPSPWSKPTAPIENDIPWAGINMTGEMVYYF